MLDSELKQLRRSRIAAKEFAWLDPGREHLSAPASPSSASRIIPALFVHNRTPLVKQQDQYHLMSMDAFLQATCVSLRRNHVLRFLRLG